jgi:hypothetical protein
MLRLELELAELALRLVLELLLTLRLVPEFELLLTLRLLLVLLGRL